MWNPDLYLRYADERGRPFHELVTRIGAENANAILDLGCGPGNLTETLVKRWPAARVHGVDASPEMIAKAVSGTTGVTYEVADLATYEIPDDVDVIVTNATLQWVPGHDRLLRSWVRPGRWIAMQVPANHNAPGHTAMRDLCAAPRWAAKLGAIAETIRMPGSAVHYGRLLRHEGCVVDTWETNYIHQLPAADPHPVLTWMSGTALGPVREMLTTAEWDEFSAELDRELRIRYPDDAGVVDFPFLRVFAVGYRPALG